MDSNHPEDAPMRGKSTIDLRARPSESIRVDERGAGGVSEDRLIRILAATAALMRPLGGRDIFGDAAACEAFIRTYADHGEAIRELRLSPEADPSGDPATRERSEQ